MKSMNAENSLIPATKKPEDIDKKKKKIIF